jgi:excisionase family DNA binding protein
MENLLTITQAAKLLTIHPRTLDRFARRGSIPSYMVGRRFRFKESDLENWLEEQRVTPQPTTTEAE